MKSDVLRTKIKSSWIMWSTTAWVCSCKIKSTSVHRLYWFLPRWRMELPLCHTVDSKFDFLYSSCLFFCGAFPAPFSSFLVQRVTSLYIPRTSCAPVCDTSSPNPREMGLVWVGVGVFADFTILTQRPPQTLSTEVEDCSLKFLIPLEHI